MKISLFLYFTFFFFEINAQQLYTKQNQRKKYSPQEVCDSLNGIGIYDKLIDVFGEDTMRFNKDGYNISGWVEDLYTNNKVIHRGFYREGKVIVFKNFYVNGACEREVKQPTPTHCQITTYYQSGHPKFDGFYNGKTLTKEIHYNKSGLILRWIEYDTEGRRIILKKNYDSNGTLIYEFKVSDTKTKKYIETTYHSNGMIKEQGALVYSEEEMNYQKIGVWYAYDENGKNKQSVKMNNEPVKLTSN